MTDPSDEQSDEQTVGRTKEQTDEQMDKRLDFKAIKNKVMVDLIPCHQVVITPERLANMILIIVIDASEPREIWNLVTTLHDQVARRIHKTRPRGRVNGKG